MSNRLGGVCLSKFMLTLIPAILGSFVCAYGDPMTIASDLGPGNTFQTGTGNSWANGDGPNSANAVSFVVPTGQNYILHQILVADNWFTGTGSLNVDLYSGSNPNTAMLLESFVIPTSSTTQFASVLFTLTSPIQQLLVGGNTYLIEESIGACGTALTCATTWGWQWNNLSPAQTGFYARLGSGSWFAETTTTPAYAVTAAPVPEPGSLTLLAIASGLLGFFRGRKRHALLD
jgi:hypothetical protein